MGASWALANEFAVTLDTDICALLPFTYGIVFMRGYWVVVGECKWGGTNIVE
jgi:hypothetical protein